MKKKRMILRDDLEEDLNYYLPNEYHFVDGNLIEHIEDTIKRFDDDGYNIFIIDELEKGSL